MTHDNDASRPRWLVGYAAVLWAACFVGAVYAVDGSRPTNALDLPLQDDILLRQLVPQGWAFFTKDPQSEAAEAFARQDGSWRPAGPGPGASPRYLFGFDRKARAFGTELAMLVAAARSELTDCSGDPRACLDAVDAPTSVRNESPSPALCGDVALVLRQPVPWAWSGTAEPVFMRSRVAVLEVGC